jgi:glycosyltransferase involved in cell wall biosynthesis
MRICAVVKYPPIQGGVSALSYRLVMSLAEAGHQVSVVTNADEVEDDYRIWMEPADRAKLEATFPNGGSVTLVATSPLGRKHTAHVPDHKPFATKLAALATEEIRRIDADVVYSYYLEPYGLAAHLAAAWTGRPHVVQHAGSDRTRLLAHPDLSVAYREVLRRADLIVAHPGTIEGYGIPAERVASMPPRGAPAGFADPNVAPLDVNARIAALAAAGHPWITNTAPMPGDLPTIGIYGKLSVFKGSYDLVAALRRCKEAGRRFNLLVMAGGYQRERFLRAVDTAGLAEMTWTLPFMPPWRVPEFLRALTAGCFLERDFPVAIHSPGIPREVMAAGTCLVLSREIADKQYNRDEFRHGENVLVVEDPRDTDELAGVLDRIITDPESARAIGKAGAAVAQGPDATTEEGLGEAFVRLFERAIAAQGGAAPATRDEVPAWRRLVNRFMPATVALLGDAVDGMVREAITRPAVSEAHRAYAAADAIVDAVGEPGAGLPPVAEPAARFERDLLWSHLDLESLHGATMFPRQGAARLVLSDPVSFGARAPVASNTLRVRPHRRDVETLLTAVRAGTPYDAADDRPATYLFLKRGDLDGKVIRISSATAEMLRLCDGRTRIADIMARLVDQYGIEEAAVERMLLDLVDMRAIRL